MWIGGGWRGRLLSKLMSMWTKGEEKGDGMRVVEDERKEWSEWRGYRNEMRRCDDEMGGEWREEAPQSDNSDEDMSRITNFV